MFNLFKNVTEKTVGFTHGPYTGEKGEIILGTFRNVPISHALFTPTGIQDITLTDTKVVISLRTGGGYPGYEFYFDPNTKLPFNSLSSTIKSIEMRKDGIIIKSKGYFSITRIQITGEKKEELFELLNSGINKYLA
jgi:hypothetical protein